MASPLTRFLPKPLVDFVRGCRYRGTAEHLRFLAAARANRRRHALLNAALPHDRLALAEGVTFAVLPEVRSTFEEFSQGNAEMVDEMAAFLKLTEGCRCFLDIGALYGAFSLAFCAKTGQRALAFEPNQASRTLLERHIAANPNFQIQAIPFGLGEVSGSVPVEAGFHFTALGTNSPPAATELPVDHMKVVSLDEFCAAESVDPDLLKIDVEGFEHFVLLGGRRTLERCKPKLLIEFHTELMATHGHRLEATVAFLEDLGYVALTPRLRPIDANWRRRTGNLRGVFIPR